MTAPLAAKRYYFFCPRGIFYAACACSKKYQWTGWADCVEKLVGFSLSKWVIALILLGRLYVDHDVSLWRAPTA
jgi:hypothetical protein